MDCKKALKSGILATTLLVVAISITTTTTTATNVQASNNDDDDDNNDNNDNPLSGALRDLASGIDESDAGTDAGRDQARQDFYSGQQKTPCPGEPGPWCFGYNTGYDSVMNNLESAHR